MENEKPPSCAHDTAPDAACPACAQANDSGKAARPKPPLPPELAHMVFEPVPPEMADEFRRTFNEAEYLTAVREMKEKGSFRLEDFIDEIERIANGRE